jgi:hypothetical protein
MGCFRAGLFPEPALVSEPSWAVAKVATCVISKTQPALRMAAVAIKYFIFMARFFSKNN